MPIVRSWRFVRTGGRRWTSASCIKPFTNSRRATAVCTGLRLRTSTAAWLGETPRRKVLDELLDVARTIIQLRKENGEPIPDRLLPLSLQKGSLTITA